MVCPLHGLGLAEKEQSCRSVFRGWRKCRMIALFDSRVNEFVHSRVLCQFEYGHTVGIEYSWL